MPSRVEKALKGHHFVMTFSVTLDRKTAAAEDEEEEESRGQAGDWLASQSRWCNDTNILWAGTMCQALHYLL